MSHGTYSNPRNNSAIGYTNTDKNMVEDFQTNSENGEEINFLLICNGICSS